MRNTDIYCPILKNWPVYDIIIVEAGQRVRFSGLFVLFSTIPKDITGNLDKKKKIDILSEYTHQSYCVH